MFLVAKLGKYSLLLALQKNENLGSLAFKETFIKTKHALKNCTI